jgi:hypothetical protein
MLLIGFVDRARVMTETSLRDRSSRSGLISLDPPDIFMPKVQSGTSPLYTGISWVRGWSEKKFVVNFQRYAQGRRPGFLGRPKSLASLQKGGCRARNFGD